MRKIIFALFVLGLGGGWFATNAQAEGGPAIGNDGSGAFHAALRDYFKVTEEQVTACQQQNVGDEELPVVFFIAQRANVDPNAVLAVKSSGLNWMQVANHFRVNPRVLFMPLPTNAVAHSPYEKGYEFYKNHSDRVSLKDADIINFVNLKFLSEAYGCDPREIIQMRGQGKSFGDINAYYFGKKQEAEWDVEPIPQEDQSTPTDKPKTDRALDAFEHTGHMGMGGM